MCDYSLRRKATPTEIGVAFYRDITTGRYRGLPG